MYTLVDIFCGCGGMSWGLHKAGFRTLAGVDNNAIALKTFEHNHQDAKAYLGDITQLKAETVMYDLGIAAGSLDCLVGGPPCQGFSKNVPAAYRFLDDPRNLLFRDYLGYVDALRPKTIIMENVAPIYKAYEGAVRQEIVNRLNEMGYKVTVKVVWAHKHGIPQKRQRCFFFATNTGVSPTFPREGFSDESSPGIFSDVKNYRSAWSAISDLPVLQHGEGKEPLPYPGKPHNEYQALLRQDSEEVYDHIARKMKPKQFKRVSSLGAGEGMKDLPKHLQPKSGYSGAYGRLDFDSVAPTITRWVFHSGSGRFCHPKEPRLITMREAARIQSFSDDFKFIGTYIEKAHQIGNAVPPLLMTQFAKNIKACLVYQEEGGQPLQVEDDAVLA